MLLTYLFSSPKCEGAGLAAVAGVALPVGCGDHRFSSARCSQSGSGSEATDDGPMLTLESREVSDFSRTAASLRASSAAPVAGERSSSQPLATADAHFASARASLRARAADVFALGGDILQLRRELRGLSLLRRQTLAERVGVAPVLRLDLLHRALMSPATFSE